MTVGVAIKEVDLLMPNDINNQIKIDWLKRLDMQLTDEIVNTHKKPEGYETPNFDDYDVTTNMVVDELHADLYIPYLRMKIAQAQMESERYQMEYTNFNNQLITYRNYYNRKYMPITKAVPKYR